MNVRTVLLTVMAAAMVGLCQHAAHAQGDAQALRIHFVAADNSGAPSDPKLDEFIPLLRKNLPYDSFELLSYKKTTVREQKITLSGGYELALDELVDTALSVELRKGDDRLLKTRLTLRPEKPVILGGFSYGNGKALLIIVMGKQTR